MSELCEQQRNDMAPRTKVPSPFGRAGATGQLADQMCGNEIAQLPKDGKFALGWRVSVFFHPCRVAA
jgi:hypothetical protein